MNRVDEMGLMIACALAATGCAAEVGAARPADMPARAADQVSSTVMAEVRAPIADVFRYVADEQTPARDLRSYGPVPGVRGGVRLTGGGWDHVGARRVVVLEDGATLVEEIQGIDAPTRFSYRVSGFTSAVKALASEGRGHWELSPTERGTQVSWTYTFNARSCPAQPALRAMVSAAFHPYMERALASIKRHVELGAEAP